MSLFKNESQNSMPEARDAQPKTPSDRGEKARRKGRNESGMISVFGAGLVVEGEVRTKGDIQIEGRVEGNLEVDGQVSIAAPGSIKGDVVADRIVVAGKVDGSLEARDSTRLVSGAEVDADISSPRLELEEGAILNGTIDMGNKAKKSSAQNRIAEKPQQNAKPEDGQKRDVA